MKILIAFSWLLCLVMVVYADTQVGNLEYSVNNGTATVRRVASIFPGGPITIPAEVTIGDDTYPVKTIAADAFRNNTDITEVIIQEGVETIGISSFEECSGLQDVSIPGSVTEINTKAFNVGKNNVLEVARFVSLENLCNITFADEYSNPLYNAQHLYIGGSNQETTEIILPATATIKPRIFAGASSITWTLVKRYTIKAYAHKTGLIKSDEIQNATITWCNGTPVFGNGFTSVTLEESNPKKGDVNGDGVVDVNDITTIVNIIQQ